MPKENKSNNAEFQSRVLAVENMLLAGLKRSEIIIQAKMFKYNVSDRTIDNYIQTANIEIERIGKINSEATYHKIKARYEFIYKKLIEKNDFRGAINLLDKECELDGLKTQKIEANLGHIRIIELPDNGRNI